MRRDQAFVTHAEQLRWTARSRRWPVVLAAFIAVVGSLAGCSSLRDENSPIIPQTPGLVARMSSPGSAVRGSVRIYDYRDGVAVQLAVDNLYPGQYRLALHEVGNCSSPNLFSAGPPWAPPGWTKPPGELLPGFLANPEGNMNNYIAYISGVRTEGPTSIRGKSVVIHWGNTVSQAFPGQPNNRMACGVLETADPLL